MIVKQDTIYVLSVIFGRSVATEMIAIMPDAKEGVYKFYDRVRINGR